MEKQPDNEKTEDKRKKARAMTAPAWKSIFQREQGKLMEVLVEPAEYDPHDVAISLSFHRSGIKTLAAKADEVLARSK